MQRALFLTSNLCGIWCHGEFGNKESAIQGTGALTGAWWSVSLRLLLVSTLNFPPLVCNTKTGPKGRKICHPHCTSLKLLQLTTPLPCGKNSFLSDFVDPFFIYSQCLGVSSERLDSPSPIGASMFLNDSPQRLSLKSPFPTHPLL